MHVEVEEPDLGVGDPADRLRVDAHQLEQRDERKARLEDLADSLHRLGVLLGEPALERRRRAEQRHEPLDQGLLQPGSLGHLRRGEESPLVRQQVLDEAEGQPPLADGRPQLGQRVTPLAHPRDHAGLRRGGTRPAPALERDHAGAGPALEGRRRHPG